MHSLATEVEVPLEEDGGDVLGAGRGGVGGLGGRHGPAAANAVAVAMADAVHLDITWGFSLRDGRASLPGAGENVPLVKCLQQES